MTATTFAPPLSAPIPGSLKKKRVLLVDTSSAKRDLRAEVMRKLGMDVDCAADITEARSWWRADLYDLVLINAEKGSGHRDRFCDDIRSATPRQQLAFLVGKPEYLANVPGLDGESVLPTHRDESLIGDVKTALSLNLADLSQRWGIMEASRRISAVRSASNARTKAMRERPAPPRDLEMRNGKRSPDEPPSLDDLLREEMQ
ncbi:MAG TPA: response regulator [Candidatus Sulfotelmatobacter sp.]|jgi:CheY-like chemotaxis protein|nr:response regulator [Candidatus Sulfotelmatobacter sp.]